MTAADGDVACRAVGVGLGGGAARAADIALVARCSCCRRKSEPAAAKGLPPKSSLMIGLEDGMPLLHGGRCHELRVAWNDTKPTKLYFQGRSSQSLVQTIVVQGYFYLIAAYFLGLNTENFRFNGRCVPERSNPLFAGMVQVVGSSAA